MSAYDVKLATSAARTFESLAPKERARVRQALERLSIDVATPGRVGGKTVKTIKGASDSFHRLRIGDHRVMSDVIVDDRTILVLGIVHRRDLESWLRDR